VAQVNIVSLTNNRTNCYLLQLKEGWLMVDTGLPDTFSQLLQLLNQHDISVYEINYLIITHFHPDHAGLTQNLRDLGINLVLHEDQVSYIKELNAFYKRNPKAKFKDIVGNNIIVLSESDSSSFLESIGIQGNLIATPGHTDDSISLVIDDCCAFVGDLPAYDLVEAYDDLVIEDSWEMLKKYHVKTIYPSHGDVYELK
jgi:glyoxylase-like metal-dependent hydrolase (beta-lactamase superfamily II)